MRGRPTRLEPWLSVCEIQRTSKSSSPVQMPAETTVLRPPTLFLALNAHFAVIEDLTTRNADIAYQFQ